jgi:hypothetical protein
MESLAGIEEVLENYDIGKVNKISVLSGGSKNISFKIITEDCDYNLKKILRI